MSYILGLDIGVASVGWGIVDKNSLNVVDSGVALFDSADASKNIDRRTFRQGKRLKRRRINRIKDIQTIFKGIDFERDEEINNQLELRNKGLEYKLTKEEIVAAILHIAKRRGISYLEDSIDENIKEEDIEKNRDELENRLPGQIQFQRLKDYGKYRGIVNVNKEEKLNNIFTTSKYKKEGEAILKKQKEFYPELTDEIIEKILETLVRKRKYYIGPGNENSKTDYGIYKKDGRILLNLFEELIGKCSIYNEETRAAGASYTAQEFNILNDLNNIRVNNESLSKEEKVKLIEHIKNSDKIGSATVHKEIAKIKGCDINEIRGNRIDRAEKPEYHTFEAYREMKKLFKEYNINIDDLGVEVLDELARVLTINTEKEGILEEFEKNQIFKQAGFSNEVIDGICLFRKKKSSTFSKWQSLSLKAMKEIREELINTDKNQSTIFHELGKFKTNIEKYKEYSSLPREEIIKEIYNPIARRSIIQTINITNSLLKKYNNISDIVIEMPRDFEPSAEVKKNNQKIQNDNEKKLNKIIAEIKDQYGLEINDSHFRNNKQLALKLKLWEEQEGRCSYSNKPIPIESLINNRENFEIDHIIPISISFDDSQNNKTLVFSDENQKKGNKTPYQYLSSKASGDWTYKDYKNTIIQLKNNKKISDRKKNNYLYEGDINKMEVLKSFITRNLNDTRYASRVILNSFSDYFNAHGKAIKVKVIRGSFTSQLRKKFRLKKEREESFAHHGIDALICCYSLLSSEKYLKGSLNVIVEGDKLLDVETGEIIQENFVRKDLTNGEYDAILNFFSSNKIRDNLIGAENKMRYSHKVDKKVNRGVSKQTIRSTRVVDDKYMLVAKKNIYIDKDYESLKKIIDDDLKKNIDNKDSCILMRKHDPKTFDILLKTIETYEDAKNPFSKAKEEGNPLRKYAKDGRGHEIIYVKYLEKELGSHIDISNNYKVDGKKIVLLSLNPYRADIYYDIKKGIFKIIGIKHNDFKFEKGKYILDMDRYINELIREKVIGSPEEYESKIGKDILFKFSLYKNDLLAFGESKATATEYRFLSRTKPNQANYIEVKPINKAKYEKQKLIGINKNIQYFAKINTDILGNKHYTSQESFIINFNID